MLGQCFYCKQKGRILKDGPKKKKGFKPQNGTSNVHTDANHVNLDRSQQSNLVEGIEKGKNVQPSKDDKGKRIQLSKDEMWRPIEQYPIRARI